MNRSSRSGARSAALFDTTNTPIIEEARERGPAFEHVLHGFGDVIAARELGALRAHPAFQIGDQWRAELLADSSALLGTAVH